MFALYLIIKLFPLLLLLLYIQLHRLMCQAAELLFSGKVVNEGGKAGVVAQTEVAPFLIAP